MKKSTLKIIRVDICQGIILLQAINLLIQPFSLR